MLSAAVLLWRFRHTASDESAERRAARIAGVLLVILTVYVVAAAALLGYSKPSSSLLGIIILIASAVIMPGWRDRSGGGLWLRVVQHCAPTQLNLCCALISRLLP
jgi:hypothetical protein